MVLHYLTILGIVYKKTWSEYRPRIRECCGQKVKSNVLDGDSVSFSVSEASRKKSPVEDQGGKKQKSWESGSR